MGYVRKKIYKLQFEEAEFDGLEVRMGALPLRAYLRLQGLDFGDQENAEEVIQLIADNIVSWNLEEPRPDLDGCPTMPVPTTMDALLALDLDFVLAVVNGWVDAAGSVPAPLEQPSPGGEPSLVASIPMDVPSPSLSSLSMPSGSSGSVVPSTFSPAPS